MIHTVSKKFKIKDVSFVGLRYTSKFYSELPLMKWYMVPFQNGRSPDFQSRAEEETDTLTL